MQHSSALVSAQERNRRDFLDAVMMLCVLQWTTQVGKRYIVDPTLEEEICMRSKIVASVNAQGKICSLEKTGRMGLKPSELGEILQVLFCCSR